MTLTTFSNGTLIKSSEVNANFLNAYPRAVASTPYTGTGFDASRSGSTGTTTNNTTLTVAANSVTDYIRIVLTIYATGQFSTSGNDGQAQLKLETSVASAASWTTRFDQAIAVATGNSSGPHNVGGVRTVEFYYAPTAGEKSGGLDIRITGTVVTTGASGAANINNVQTMIFAN